jgi:hypothetical protein
MSAQSNIALMQAIVYGEYGVPALWTSDIALSVPLTILPDQADQAGQIGGLGRQTLERNVFRVRVSEVEANAPGVHPKRGDIVQLVDATGAPIGRRLSIIDPPARNDTHQTEWTLVCG